MSKTTVSVSVSVQVTHLWAERKTERSGPKIGWSGAERGGSIAENDEALSRRSRGGNGAGSGLNRPLTARCNLHWHNRVARILILNKLNCWRSVKKKVIALVDSYCSLYDSYGIGQRWSEPKIGWSGAVSGSCRKTMERSGARSGNGAGVKEIGWSAGQLFRRSRSAQMLRSKPT